MYNPTFSGSRHKVLETTDRCTKHCSQPAQRPLSHGWASSRLLYMKRAELTFEARAFIGEELDGQDVYDVPAPRKRFPRSQQCTWTVRPPGSHKFNELPASSKEMRCTTHCTRAPTKRRLRTTSPFKRLLVQILLPSPESTPSGKARGRLDRLLADSAAEERPRMYLT